MIKNISIYLILFQIPGKFLPPTKSTMELENRTTNQSGEDFLDLNSTFFIQDDPGTFLAL